MKKPLTCLLFISLFAFTFIRAQNFQDCTNAFKVCAAQGTTHFGVAEGSNSFDSDLGGTCLPMELGSTWIYWTVIQGGWMTFTLFPDSSYQDLNFILFKTNAPGDCSSKEKIRCMASGENIGADPSTWVACTGDTGLSAGQPDINESAGCSPGDNNLLAAHAAETGDHYLMMINNSNFSTGGTPAGFTLQFGGSVNLDCTNVISNNNDLTNTTPSLSIYPNPSKGLFFIEVTNEALLGGNLLVYNVMGQVVYREHDLAQGTQALDLQHLPKGSYLVALEKDGFLRSSRISIF